MPLETAWIGLTIKWGRVLENHKVGFSGAIWVDRDSDMVHTCQLCREGFRTRTMISVSTSVWEKTAPPLSTPAPALILMSQILVPPGFFQVVALVLELKGSESKQLSAQAL